MLISYNSLLLFKRPSTTYVHQKRIITSFAYLTLSYFLAFVLLTIDHVAAELGRVARHGYVLRGGCSNTTSAAGASTSAARRALVVQERHRPEFRRSRHVVQVPQSARFRR